METLERRLLLAHDLALPLVFDGAEGEATTQVRFRLEATDLAGTPIAATPPGSDFYLAAWVSDVRTAVRSAGVFAAFLDVVYDAELLEVVPSSSNPLGFEIEFGEFYQNGVSGKAGVAGLIDEAGAFQVGFTPLGSDEFLLFRVRLSTGDVHVRDDTFGGLLEDSGPVELDVLANDQMRLGRAVFSANPADVRPAHDVLLFSPPTVVAPNAMQFVGTELAISGEGRPVITHVSVPSAGGVARVSDDGTRVVYTSPPDFFGTDTFTYSVGDSGAALVTVVVEPDNDPPIAVDDLYSVDYQTPLVVSAARGVLANDIDVEGDELIAKIVQQPEFGSLVLHDDGGFEYLPAEGFRGRDRFRYVAWDASMSSLVATVVIDVGTPQVMMRLEVADASGQSVGQLTAADSLWLRTWVRDLRDANYSDRGVYAAYLDLLYDSHYLVPRLDAALPRGFQIEFGPDFYAPGSGDANEPGLVNEVGAYAASFLPLGPDERLLFEMPFDPTGPRLEDDRYEVSLQSRGNLLNVLDNDLGLTWFAEFGGRAADISPQHAVLLYDPPQPVPVDRILFSGANLSLTNAASVTIVAVSATQAGGWAALAPDQRQVLYTPPAGFSGTDRFTYTVADASGRRAEGVVVIEVIANWQNVGNPLDVNGDTFVSPIDALLVISDLNRNGGRLLVDPPTGPPYLDVNGDGSVSPIDALTVINHLNGAAGQGSSDGEGERAAASGILLSEQAIGADLPALPWWELSVGGGAEFGAARGRRAVAAWSASPDSSRAPSWDVLPTRERPVDDFYRWWGRIALERRAVAADPLQTLDELCESWDSDPDVPGE